MTKIEKKECHLYLIFLNEIAEINGKEEAYSLD